MRDFQVPGQAFSGEALFVSRHRGAADWARRRGIAARAVEHLDLNEVGRGMTVIGTLPVHIVAEICARGARYLHLALDLPPQARGREIDADEMDRYGARLVRIDATVVHEEGEEQP